jgi:putative hydrolase of the HAD superfamily
MYITRYKLPEMLFIDLDDTVLAFDSVSRDSWKEVCGRYAALCSVDETRLNDEIQKVAAHYWSDPERHRIGRLRLDATRRMLVREAMMNLGIDDGAIAENLANDYIEMREMLIRPFDGALDALGLLKTKFRMALITNGESHKQRAKIERFSLEHYFEHIFIEEETGFGKPDVRAFEHAMSISNVSSENAWMIGDNLEWDIAAPQKLGIYAIWNDWKRKGLPAGSAVIPDKIVCSLAEFSSQLLS